MPGYGTLASTDSADMGSGGFAQATCDDPMFGDDGVLETDGNLAGDPLLDCRGSYPPFVELELADGGCAADPDACAAAAADVACVAALGTSGCGFEQPLEAMLKAVVPDVPACTQPFCNFFGPSRGHGTDPTTNGGFVRPSAMLGVLVLTDGDDCSAANPDLFNRNSGSFLGSLNTRCIDHPEALYASGRYVDGLRFVKGDPRLVFYSVIAGVPSRLVDTASSSGEQDFDAMLADPVLTPREGARACISANGEADPGQRLVTLARDLEAVGATATVQSICETDYTGAVDAIMTRLDAALPAP